MVEEDDAENDSDHDNYHYSRRCKSSLTAGTLYIAQNLFLSSLGHGRDAQEARYMIDEHQALLFSEAQSANADLGPAHGCDCLCRYRRSLGLRGQREIDKIFSPKFFRRKARRESAPRTDGPDGLTFNHLALDWD